MRYLPVTQTELCITSRSLLTFQEEKPRGVSAGGKAARRVCRGQSRPEGLQGAKPPGGSAGGKAARRVCRGQSCAAGLQRMTTSAIPQKKILLTSHTFLFNDKFDFTWGPQAIMFSQIRDSAE